MPTKRQRSNADTPVIQWLLEKHYPGTMPVELDNGEGRRSRWNTLWGLRVLRWYSDSQFYQRQSCS